MAKHANQRKMLLVVIYAWVSMLDQQTLPMQNRPLREYATQRGWTVRQHGNSANN